MNKELSKISLGLINFTNCIPVNYSLYEWSHDKLVLSEGYPTLINQLMRDKQVHVAPISSIEYLNNQDLYTLIDNVCISSDGEVDSVILFSNYDFMDLEEKTIGIPYTSSSSIALLKILLNEYQYDLNRIKFKTHKYETSLEDALKNRFDAVLYIGDPALIANIKYQDQFKKYDLGKLWKDFTGYPMTFGTWVAQSDWASSQEDDYNWICFILDKAVEAGLNMYFNEIINITSTKLNLDKNHIENYLTKKINYNFTQKHKEGLELFKKLYDNLNIKPDNYSNV
ncbi:MAG: hypothetical protein A2104_09325 [Candidatus Melainabacteria bacterium GWF2_32_7]|nr:MAG: hypothetical protein A2104_09325 [Candidatus Melainabacteria bacterium GWF2_32_7]